MLVKVSSVREGGAEAGLDGSRLRFARVWGNGSRRSVGGLLLRRLLVLLLWLDTWRSRLGV